MSATKWHQEKETVHLPNGKRQYAELTKLTRRVVRTRDGKGGGIAMSAGKRQALKHGEVDVLPGSGVRGDDVFAGTPVTICRFNNTKSFRLTFRAAGQVFIDQGCRWPLLLFDAIQPTTHRRYSCVAVSIQLGGRCSQQSLSLVMVQASTTPRLRLPSFQLPNMPSGEQPTRGTLPHNVLHIWPNQCLLSSPCLPRSATPMSQQTISNRVRNTSGTIG